MGKITGNLDLYALRRRVRIPAIGLRGVDSLTRSAIVTSGDSARVSGKDAELKLETARARRR